MRNISATLPNKPTIESDALQVLQEATLWLDAAYSIPGEQTAKNLGTGGAALNAQYGSTAGVDTNDPLLLPWTGENYLRTTTAIADRLTAPSYQFPVDASFDIRIDCIRSNTPAVNRRVVEDQVFLDFLTDNSISATFRTSIDTFPGLSSSAASINAVVPLGGRIHVRVTWEPSIDTLSIFVRTPNYAIDSDVGWVFLNSVVHAGVQVYSAFTRQLRLGVGQDTSQGGDATIYKYWQKVNSTVIFNLGSDSFRDSGATTLVDLLGNTWTIGRSTSGRKTALVTRPTWLFGTDDYLQVTDNALIDFNLAVDNMTVLVVSRSFPNWVAFTDFITKQTGLSPTGNKGWEIRFNNVSGTFDLALGDGNAAGNFNNFRAGPNAYLPAALQSIFGVCTAGSAVTYLNDIASAATAGLTLDMSNTANLTIGPALDGEIVAVAIWRRALTVAEITAINAHYGTLPPSPAEQLLAGAYLWLDAKNSVPGEQKAVNRGRGGSAMDATYGSTTGVDTNDPLILPHTPGNNYLALPGLASNYLSVPDETALNIAGDLTIVARVTLDDWTPATRSSIVSKHSFPGISVTGWTFAVGTTGALVFTYGDGVSAFTAASSVPTGFTDGSTRWIKVTFDANNGSGGRDFKFYTAPDSNTLPTSWTQLGTTQTVGSIISIASNTSICVLGATPNNDGLLSGRIYRAFVQNAIDSGTTVLDFNAATNIVDSGATSFVATSGQTVTVNRATSGRKLALVTRPIWLFGTDDYLEIADNALLDFNATDDFTVLAVVRQWGTPVSFSTIMGKWDSAAPLGYRLYNNPGSVVYTFEVSDGVTPRYGDTSPTATSPGQLKTAVGGASGTGATIFADVDATPATQARTPMGSITNAIALRIGHTVAGLYVDAEIMAVAVFRRALTSPEIALIRSHYGSV